MNNIRKVIDNFTINRKTLGAFYTPTFLADYLARETMSLSTLDEDNSYTIFDPAMGPFFCGRGSNGGRQF